MTRTHIRFALPLVAAALAACGPRAETWGFVAALGNDTTSVERVTRAGNHVTGEQLERSPVVLHRTWSEDLAPDGSLLHWTLDTHIPNAPAGRQDRHHELIFTGNTVRIIRRTPSDSTDHRYVTGYVKTVPWNAFLYASYEGLFQAARGLADTAKIGSYFFEGWDEGSIGVGQVGHLPNGDVSLYSDGLAGLGEAKLDGQGRMLSYSGMNTTYKQRVFRVAAAQLPDIPAMLDRYAADEKAHGIAHSLSPRDTMRAQLGRTQITVDYGRPSARGRMLVGGLLPYGEVWRTGANAATQLMVSTPVTLAGVPLKAGTYTLWTLPSESGVQLIINGQSGQWGTEYDASKDIARRPMVVDNHAPPIDLFTISVNPATGTLQMHWGTFAWSVPIGPAAAGSARSRG